MSTLPPLRPAADAGALAPALIWYVSATSVLTAVNDNSDTSYAWARGPGNMAQWTLPAHGLAAGTTINSVTLYWRKSTFGGNAQYVYGGYKRSGDAGITWSPQIAPEGGITQKTMTIPAPTGGWTLTHLTNLIIAGKCQGDGTSSGGNLHDIWVSVDYTEPPATVKFISVM